MIKDQPVYKKKREDKLRELGLRILRQKAQEDFDKRMKEEYEARVGNSVLAKAIKDAAEYVAKQGEA